MCRTPEVVVLDVEAAVGAAGPQIAHDQHRAADRDCGHREADQRAARPDLLDDRDGAVADPPGEVHRARADAPGQVTAAITDRMETMPDRVHHELRWVASCVPR